MPFDTWPDSIYSVNLITGERTVLPYTILDNSTPTQVIFRREEDKYFDNKNNDRPDTNSNESEERQNTRGKR